MGTTILLVTHDPELARRAQRNVHLIDGQVSDFRAYESRAAAPGEASAAAAALG
jgi:putative ABC transport system ATP-binding protein